MPTQLPGYNLLFQTSRPDACAVYLPTHGLRGMFGRKEEFVVTMSSVNDMMQFVMEKTPEWFVTGGLALALTQELMKWSIQDYTPSTS